jgi:xanthine dehydrogenase molybdopterin-binding subunit B
LAPLKEQMKGASWKEIVSAAYFSRTNLSAHAFYKVGFCAFFI